MIQAVDIRAGYGDGPDILQGVSIEARPGEIVSILGPNGCGKSTLLRCIAGFLIPRAGSIRIDNQDVTVVPVHRKIKDHRVGYVPQTNNVFATLTVLENVLLGTRFLPKKEQLPRAWEMLSRYPGLSARAHGKASGLSGGERQLLSLARALAANPSTLLLDEPSAGLSPRMTDEVFEAIDRIRAQLDLTILVVEQNAAEALEVSDRVYVLSLGQVAVKGLASAMIGDSRMKDLYLGGGV